MPIYLPPISRRRFLRRSLAAAASLALSPKLFASSRKTDPDSWALLADTHLAADRATLGRGINMADNFTIVSRELVALEKSPAGIFVVGDCAFNSGETADYSTVANLLEPLRKQEMPIHLTLGNHDNRERFWDVLQNEKTANRPLTDKQVALLRTPKANWFILDSLEKTLSTPGLLGEEQLHWLAKTLDENPSKPALILIHHNPGLQENMGLKDTVLLYDILRPRKQVKAYIYGHTHNWKVEQDFSGIHLINLPPVAYVFQPGDPSGWVHATLGSKGIRLELRCVNQTHKAHGEIKNLTWRS